MTGRGQRPPSIRRWRRAVLWLYRRMPLVLRSRLAVWVHRHRRLPRATYPVPVGAGLAGMPPSDLPVVIMVTMGSAGTSLEHLVGEIAAIQVATRGFRPVFVTDTDDFAPFRRHGYLFEHIMAIDDWAMLHDRSLWSQYLEGRLAQLRRVYGTRLVVEVPADIPQEALGGLLTARTLSSTV